MEEKEFKKLASNSRDWLIYKRLKDISTVNLKGDVYHKKPPEIVSEHVSGVSIKEQEEQAPKGETSVEETVTGKVVHITDDAVLIGVGDRVAWFPKSTITNLDKIVLEKGKTLELKIVDWFKYKIEWKVPQNG